MNLTWSIQGVSLLLTKNPKVFIKFVIPKSPSNFSQLWIKGNGQNQLWGKIFYSSIHCVHFSYDFKMSFPINRLLKYSNFLLDWLHESKWIEIPIFMPPNHQLKDLIQEYFNFILNSNFNFKLTLTSNLNSNFNSTFNYTFLQINGLMSTS